MRTIAICESCRAISATREVEAEALPFRVCDACERRLRARALRPLEWFNLASIHGPYEFLLHDDFYDDGRALQSAVTVEAPERCPLPSLAAVDGNPDRLLDFATTRHFVWEQLEPELVAALRRIEPSTLLPRLRKRVETAKNEHVEHVCLVVCGHAVGPLGSTWVDERYAAPSRDALLGALAFAGSRCLPEARAFELASRALEPVKRDLPSAALGSLGWLRSERTLDWIERSVRPPLVEAWGRLAAVSRPPWERLETWIARGRPLSLVALDALVAIGIARAANYHAGAPMLRWLEPSLGEPPTAETATTTLESYVTKDDAPRVRRAVRAILQNWGLVAGAIRHEWIQR